MMDLRLETFDIALYFILVEIFYESREIVIGNRISDRVHQILVVGEVMARKEHRTQHLISFK